MKTIYLISPREPSGLSWLYNCFLCLGIKTHYVHPRNGGEMWQLDGGEYVLNPVDDIQKKWAPILSKKSRFTFRDDFQVQFDHIWPTGWQRDQKIIFIVRNPYDSLSSRWMREANNISFAEFLKVPDHTTLLDKIDNWQLFCESWLARRNHTDWHLVRFEDYKRDAEETLRDVISFLDVEISDQEITYALSQSGVQEAKQAEESYQPTVPSWLRVCDDIFYAYKDRRVIGVGVNNPDSNDQGFERDYVMQRTANVCSEFGYLESAAYTASPSYLPQKAMLSFYRHLDMPEEWFGDCAEFDIHKYSTEIEKMFEYVRDVEILLHSIGQAGLIFGEVATLFATLQEMQKNYLKLAQPKQDIVINHTPESNKIYSCFSNRFFNIAQRILRAAKKSGPV